MNARGRYLPSMTAARIAVLPDKATAPVIVTTGAIEQHGYHLPVAVDSLMAQVWTARILEALPDDVPCYVGPPITIGNQPPSKTFTTLAAKKTMSTVKKKPVAARHKGSGSFQA